MKDAKALAYIVSQDEQTIRQAMANLPADDTAARFIGEAVLELKGKP
jgi:hypothetical protein